MTTTRLSAHPEPQARQLATAMGAALVACPVAAWAMSEVEAGAERFDGRGWEEQELSRIGGGR